MNIVPELRERYTQIKRDSTAPADERCIVFFKVGVQSFQLNERWPEETAQWMCDQLATAIKFLIKQQTQKETHDNTDTRT